MQSKESQRGAGEEERQSPGRSEIQRAERALGPFETESKDDDAKDYKQRVISENGDNEERKKNERRQSTWAVSSRRRGRGLTADGKRSGDDAAADGNDDSIQRQLIGEVKIDRQLTGGVKIENRVEMR